MYCEKKQELNLYNQYIKKQKALPSTSLEAFGVGEEQKISQKSFLKIPLNLFLNKKYKKLSNTSKLLYSHQLRLKECSKKNNWIDEKTGKTYIMFSLKKAGEIFQVKKNSMVKYFQELKGQGLIKELYQEGFNKAKKFTVVDISKNNKYFLALPQELLSIPRDELSLSARLLYGFLLRRKKLSGGDNAFWVDGETGKVYIFFSRKEAGKYLNASKPSVIKYFKELETKNLIKEMEQEGYNKTNKIFVTDISEKAEQEQEQEQAGNKKLSVATVRENLLKIINIEHIKNIYIGSDKDATSTYIEYVIDKIIFLFFREDVTFDDVEKTNTAFIIKIINKFREAENRADITNLENFKNKIIIRGYNDKFYLEAPEPEKTPEAKIGVKNNFEQRKYSKEEYQSMYTEV